MVSSSFPPVFRDGMGPDVGAVKSDPKMEDPKSPSSFLGAEGRWATLGFWLSPPVNILFKEENKPVDFLVSPSFRA
jgi:hypothetical protein